MWCNRRNVLVGELGRYRLAALHFGYRAEQLTTMTECSYAEFFEVLVCQIRQNGETNVILDESWSVLPKAERLKPVRNPLHRGRTPKGFSSMVSSRTGAAKQ